LIFSTRDKEMHGICFGVTLFCLVYVQVGSLIDGSDKKNDRNAVYKYFNTLPSGEFGEFSLTRTTLVQTIKHLKIGDPVLVFYGTEYKNSAMPCPEAAE
jgi:hypothetical protein